jgi:hypothetical protein
MRSEMAEEPKTIYEWLDIDLDRLSGENKINLIGEVCDTLTVPELMGNLWGFEI